jgi:hypothetical protein
MRKVIKVSESLYCDGMDDAPTAPEARLVLIPAPDKHSS